MATRISDLTALSSGLKKNDKFEMCKTDEGKSYSCTPEDILNYCKDNANGAFRGTTTDDLDSMTKDYIGVWQWSGGGGPNNLPMGLVEVISQKSKDDMSGNDIDIIQRFTSGVYVYQRAMLDGVWNGWASLTNRNGCRIQYGEKSCESDGTAEVVFDTPFASIPAITVTPINNSASYIHIANITTKSASGFTVKMLSSDLLASEVTESTTTTGEGSATSTTYTVRTTRGAWTTSGTFVFNWIAMLEEG